MKKLSMIVLAFIVGFLAVSFASTAYADHDKVRVLSVKDIYNSKTIVKNVPVESCKQVDVPIYQKQKGNDDLMTRSLSHSMPRSFSHAKAPLPSALSTNLSNLHPSSFIIPFIKSQQRH